MSTDVPRVVLHPEPLLPTSALAQASFEERWAAWEARGAAHDRAVRRKAVIAAPILFILAAVMLYAFVWR